MFGHVNKACTPNHAARKPPVEGGALVAAAAHLNDMTRAAKRAQRDCSDLYLLLSLHRCETAAANLIIGRLTIGAGFKLKPCAEGGRCIGISLMSCLQHTLDRCSHQHKHAAHNL